RSVVVLPQPLGPSSVKSLPSGTVNVTSWAAFTIAPFSFGYSVNNPSTFNTSFSLRPGNHRRTQMNADGHGRSRSFLDSEFLPEPLRDNDQHEERQYEHHAQRRELHVLAVLPQLPDHDRDHFGAGTVEQDRARQLADRDDHHV